MEIKLTEMKSKVNRRQVSFDEASYFAKKHKLKYFETSAKTNVNVTECFSVISEDILDDISSGKINPKNEVS